VFFDKPVHLFEHLARTGFDAVNRDVFRDELVGVDRRAQAGNETDEADRAAELDRANRAVELLAADRLDDGVLGTKTQFFTPAYLMQ
jgi:hypothetical protein